MTQNPFWEIAFNTLFMCFNSYLKNHFSPANNILCQEFITQLLRGENESLIWILVVQFCLLPVKVNKTNLSSLKSKKYDIFQNLKQWWKYIFYVYEYNHLPFNNAPNMILCLCVLATIAAISWFHWFVVIAGTVILID